MSNHNFALHKKLQNSFVLRTSIVTIIFLNIVTNILAQTNTSDSTLPKDSILQIEAKLVELALKGPRYNSSEYQNKINEYMLRKAKGTWLNLLSISANYNDRSFSKQPTGPTAYVYPKYFFGLNIPLGVIFSKGVEVKSAKASIELGKNNQEQLSRDIKADILSKYREYRNLENLILIQSLVVDDEEGIYLQSKEAFRVGKISFEAHNTATKNYNGEIIRKMNLEMQKDLLELEIERIIGVDLETVIK